MAKLSRNKVLQRMRRHRSRRRRHKVPLSQWTLRVKHGPEMVHADLLYEPPVVQGVSLYT